MDWTDRLRLRNLQMLLSLARSGNMSHSAEELHTTQPNLSKWLKELEEDVGLPLFERRARGIRPTSHGEALIEHARGLVAHLEKARDDLAAMRENGAGLVAMGVAGASSVDTVIPLAILNLKRAIPAAHVRIEENELATLQAKLSAGELDIVVARSDIVFQNPEIHAESLYVEPVHVVARRGHPLASERQPSWEQLCRYGWALWAKGTPVRTAFDLSLMESGKRLPSHFIESNSASLNASILTGSDLLGIAARRPALRLEKMNILSILDYPLSVRGAVTVYWRENSRTRNTVRVALDGLRKAVRGTSTGEDSSVPAGALAPNLVAQK